MLLRTALYLPANRASAVEKARQADCDAVILDLEDAVAPEAKEEARAAAIAAVEAGGFGNRKLVIRPNGLDSEWGLADVIALAGAAPQAILVPKVSSADMIRAVHKKLPEGTEIWAMIETCQAFLDLVDIAKTGQEHGLTTFVMGTNDLALEMRCVLDKSRGAMLSLLTQAVVTARAHGLSIVDGVFNDLGDEEGFARQCMQGAAMGFDGKTVIHPRQLAIANQTFGPSDQDVEAARGLVSAFAAPENAGKGVIKHNGQMAELLHLRQAEDVLAQAQAIADRSS